MNKNLKKQKLNENAPPPEAQGRPPATPGAPPPEAQGRPQRQRRTGRRYRKCQGPDLSIGCRGDNVADLQRKILSYNIDLSPYGADGKFGKKTRRGLLELQRILGVDTTGIYDQATREAVSSGSPSPSNQPAPVGPPPAEPVGKTAPVGPPPAEPPPPAPAGTEKPEVSKDKQPRPQESDEKQNSQLSRAKEKQGEDTGPPEGEDGEGYSINNPFSGVYSMKQKYPSSASKRASGYSYKPRANKILYYVDIPDKFSFESPKNPPIKRIKSDKNGKVDLTTGIIVGNSSDLKESKNKIIDKLKIVEKRNEQIENLVFERLVKGCK